MSEMKESLFSAIAAVVISAAAKPTIWNCDIIADSREEQASEELRPISIVGVRNGVFSGKVVVESTRAIKGLKASVGALTLNGADIPAPGLHKKRRTHWRATQKQKK